MVRRTVATVHANQGRLLRMRDAPGIPCISVWSSLSGLHLYAGWQAEQQVEETGEGGR
jgi:hypothetical protein